MFNLTKNKLALICFACAAVIGVSSAMLLSVTKISQASAYVLRERNGKLVLYNAVSNQPCQEYEIYTQLLPQGDIDALRSGITVKTPQQLNVLLEDFGA